LINADTSVEQLEEEWGMEPSKDTKDVSESVVGLQD
jgi:hypothetical protein